MSDTPRCPDGHYLATASAPRLMETSDGMPFVQVMCTLESGISVDGDCVTLVPFVVLPWRGSLTRGATARTYDALCAMGSAICSGSINLFDAKPSMLLDGIGSRYFRVHVRSIPCDENEAAGKWRTFIVDVQSLHYEPTIGDCLPR